MKLRRISKKDLKMLREWRNNPAIMDWCRQVNLISPRDQLAWYIKQNDDPKISMFIIEEVGDVLNERFNLRGTARLEEDHAFSVGVCGLTDIDLINRRAEFSLYLAREYHGLGLAPKALQYLFNYGFKSLGLNLIWGETFEDNPASKLFETIGMVKEGVRRDFYFKHGKFINATLYSIRAHEWLK